MKKTIFALFFILLLAGCGESEVDPFQKEMDSCSHDACGYWKLYLTEKTENNVTYETLEIGDQYVKLTADAFEQTRHIEGEVSSYVNHEISIQNKSFSAGNVNYTFEKVENNIILTYDLGHGVIKEYYQSVTKEEYPQFSFSNEDNSNLKTVYSSRHIDGCESELCGHWKINSITRDCADSTGETVDMNRYSHYQYLKISNEIFERMNYVSENDFEISTSYYLNKDVFIYFNNTKLTSEDLTYYENSRYTVNGSTLTLSQVVIDKLNDSEVCVFNYHYTKIDEANYPKIDVYKY